MSVIKQAAIIGGGVIGAGWIGRLIENGIDVNIYDPAEDAQRFHISENGVTLVTPDMLGQRLHYAR